MAQRSTMPDAPALSRLPASVVTPSAMPNQERHAPLDPLSALATIQRQPEQPGLDDVATAVKQALPTPAATGAAPAPPAVDTDELAQQVYAAIKRKLAIERERLRLA